MTRQMRVLIACEFSGRVREAFRALGHDAISCDLEPSEDNSPHHIQGDALAAIGAQHWDMLIAHPPCTYLANSGVCRLDRGQNVERMALMRTSAAFFKRILGAPIAKIAVENPVPHGYARAIIGRPDQYIQPYEFGELETKRTGLWLRGLPPLVPTSDLKAETMALPPRVRQAKYMLAPSPTRWKDRSRTYSGIARAMAEQWGALDHDNQKGHDR